MITLTKEQESNNKVVFIRRASLCEHNHLWVCTHNDSKGKKCTELCVNYSIKGKKQNK